MMSVDRMSHVAPAPGKAARARFDRGAQICRRAERKVVGVPQAFSPRGGF